MFKSTTRIQWLVLALLITVGVICRFYLEIPNFKPVAAMMLFGGFYFRQPLLGMIGVLAMMGLSDARLGVYSWPLMLAVYFSLAVSALFGMKIRQQIGADLRGLGWLTKFLPASLAMSVIFFLLSNGAVWMMGQFYPTTLAGLLECYAMGLPMFRSTLLGDLFFTTSIVGVYVLVNSLIAARSKEQAPVQIPDGI